MIANIYFIIVFILLVSFMKHYPCLLISNHVPYVCQKPKTNKTQKKKTPTEHGRTLKHFDCFVDTSRIVQDYGVLYIKIIIN